MGFLETLKAMGETDASKKVKISHLIDVSGYNAGQEGCLLAAVDDNFVIAHLKRTKGLVFEKSDAKVKPMIGSALVTEPEDIGLLRQYCDKNTDPSKVIVVSSAFMSLFFLNPYRRILLEAESAKTNFMFSGDMTVIEQATVAEYCAALAHHWKINVDHAFKVKNRHLQKQCMKFGMAQKREIKKESGNFWQPNLIGRFKENAGA